MRKITCIIISLLFISISLVGCSNTNSHTQTKESPTLNTSPENNVQEETIIYEKDFKYTTQWLSPVAVEENFGLIDGESDISDLFVINNSKEIYRIDLTKYLLDNTNIIDAELMSQNDNFTEIKSYGLGYDKEFYAISQNIIYVNMTQQYLFNDWLSVIDIDANANKNELQALCFDNATNKYIIQFCKPDYPPKTYNIKLDILIDNAESNMDSSTIELSTTPHYWIDMNKVLIKRFDRYELYNRINRPNEKPGDFLFKKDKCFIDKIENMDEIIMYNEGYVLLYTKENDNKTIYMTDAPFVTHCKFILPDCLTIDDIDDIVYDTTGRSDFIIIFKNGKVYHAPNFDIKFARELTDLSKFSEDGHLVNIYMVDNIGYALMDDGHLYEIKLINDVRQPAQPNS